MEAILLQYGWVLIVLIILEGLLAADNAVVMAVMVRHLPRDQQKKGFILWIIWCINFPIFSAFYYYSASELLADSSTRSSIFIIHVS